MKARAPGALRRAVCRAHFVAGSLAGALGFVVLSFAGTLYALLLQRRASNAPYLFAHGFSALMQAALGWRLDVERPERLVESAPAVLVANHQSNLDIVTFGGLYPPRTVAVGKKELLKIPFFGWFFAVTGNILLDRSDQVRARASIEDAAARVRRERVSVWMFPEGHRNQTPTLLPFKKGAFHLAIAAQVPIVPVVAEPMAVVLDASRLMVRPGRIRIRVLTPIPTAGRTAEDVDAVLGEVRAAMQAARDELRGTTEGEIS